eukprot:COSAG04_NODE_24445_length_322_cov_0.461883_1_plen_77_part_10
MELERAGSVAIHRDILPTHDADARAANAEESTPLATAENSDDRLAGRRGERGVEWASGFQDALNPIIAASSLLAGFA